MNDRPNSPAIDRREALKSRHRQAIIDAAAALTAERGNTGFTVDQLAERADVSRRTVFNHFRSLDDVLLKVFARTLEEIVDGIGANLDAAPRGDGTANIFDALADAIRGTDLLTPITRLKRFIEQEDGTPSAGRAALFELAMTDVGTRLSAIVMHRYPQADPLMVDLMCGAIIGGGSAIVGRWERITGGVVNDDSRRVWSELLERILTVTRDGYGSVGTVGSA